MDTSPWSPREYQIELGNTDALDQAELNLAVAALYTARLDRPRALPVSWLVIEP